MTPRKKLASPKELAALLAKAHDGLSLDAKPKQAMCFTCGKTPVRRVADYCDACKLERMHFDRSEQIRKAAAAVPERFRGITFNHPSLREYVKQGGNVTRAHALIGYPLVCLVGPSLSGKTTLAAAMFMDVIRRAVQPGAAREQVELARKAMWLQAVKIPKARKEYELGEGKPPLWERAAGASLLVVDELIDYDNADKDMFDLLHDRHSSSLPTIVTTFMGYADIERVYGAGIANRLWDDKGRIEFRKLMAVGT